MIFFKKSVKFSVYNAKSYTEAMKDKTIYCPKAEKPYFIKTESADGKNVLRVQPDDPFSLTKLEMLVPSLKKEFSLANIVQASKVFEHGGPYVDLYGATPAAAQDDPRCRTSGSLVRYTFENTSYPLYPAEAFLIWLVFLALRQNRVLSRKLCEYDGFSCEKEPVLALAYGLYVALARNGKIRAVETFDDLIDLLYNQDVVVMKEQKPKDPDLRKSLVLRQPSRKKAFAIGDWIVHPTIGKGEVVKKDAKTYTIFFKVAGPKTLLKDFVEKQCHLM